MEKNSKIDRNIYRYLFINILYLLFQQTRPRAGPARARPAARLRNGRPAPIPQQLPPVPKRGHRDGPPHPPLLPLRRPHPHAPPLHGRRGQGPHSGTIKLRINSNINCVLISVLWGSELLFWDVRVSVCPMKNIFFFFNFYIN